MKDKGYIKIHRTSLEHWLYNSKPFDYWHAWEDILLNANFTDKKKLYKGEIQIIKAGQLPTSIKNLSERWGWSRQKVSRFLYTLECEGMVSQKRTSNGTTLTVENWGKFQIQRTTNVTSDFTTDFTTDFTSDFTHNKNVKKDKNVNNPLNPPKGDGGEDDYLRDVLRRIGRGEQVD